MIELSVTSIATNIFVYRPLVDASHLDCHLIGSVKCKAGIFIQCFHKTSVPRGSPHGGELFSLVTKDGYDIEFF